MSACVGRFQKVKRSTGSTARAINVTFLGPFFVQNLLLQFRQESDENAHKCSLWKYRGPLEAGILNFCPQGQILTFQGQTWKMA